LDVEQEQMLQEPVHELCQGRTVLVIAHRLPTLLGADKVVVIESGRIIEVGSPQQLLASNGHLSRMATQYSGKGIPA